MSFEHVAGLLLPLDEDGGAVVPADETWRLETAEVANRRTLIWGREPTWMPAGVRLVRYAASRERALRRLRRRPPRGLSLMGVHRWYYSFFEARHLPATVSRLRGGAVLELSRNSGAPRVLDAAARSAGAPGRVAAFHIGAGGQISAHVHLADKARAVLRVARTGSPVDPSRSADALEALAPLALSCVPQPMRRGQEGSASWTTEGLLAGRPPDGLTPGLVSNIARFCLQLPRSHEPSRAFAADMASLAGRLPRFSERLGELEARTAPVVDRLPSVLRHGDLWRGNVLVDGGRLSGVVDWDAWHPSAVPGTDLLQFVASARAFASQRSLAELLLERPWEDPLFAGAAANYWRELEIGPSREVLEAVGLAWWAGQTVSNLVRNPNTARDNMWLRHNVEPLLRA